MVKTTTSCVGNSGGVVESTDGIDWRPLAGVTGDPGMPGAQAVSARLRVMIGMELGMRMVFWRPTHRIARVLMSQ
jgi:hypothetical protein